MANDINLANAETADTFETGDYTNMAYLPKEHKMPKVCPLGTM